MKNLEENAKHVLSALTRPRGIGWLLSWARDKDVDVRDCLAWLSINDLAETTCINGSVVWVAIGTVLQSPTVSLCRSKQTEAKGCSCVGVGRGRCRHTCRADHEILDKETLIHTIKTFKPTSNVKAFGQLIASAENALNVTFQELGRLLKRSRASMYRWLHGITVTPRNVQKSICKRMLKLLTC